MYIYRCILCNSRYIVCVYMTYIALRGNLLIIINIMLLISNIYIL